MIETPLFDAWLERESGRLRNTAAAIVFDLYMRRAVAAEPRWGLLAYLAAHPPEPSTLVHMSRATVQFGNDYWAAHPNPTGIDLTFHAQCHSLQAFVYAAERRHHAPPS